MLPVRLEMKNFLPYRVPDPVYFEGIHLACLTGANGAGKSSLLDAITWALWGKSRARRDDDLIHPGQTEMSVQLDFEQEGNLYRVLRQRRGGKRGQGTLNFFIVQADGDLRTLNEPGMNATQKRIEQVLRLDYDTFTKSAFLKQGEADAFTTSTPGKRKETLSKILGLEDWKIYEERTKEQIKDLDIQLSFYEQRIREIDDELAREPQYQRDLDDIQTTHDEASIALETAEASLKEVEHAEPELKRQQKSYADTEARLKKYRAELTQAVSETEKQQADIERHQTVLNDEQSIQSGYETLQQARDLDSSLGKKQSQLSDLNTRISDLEKAIQTERATLEQEKAGYESSMTELERVLTSDPGDALATLTVDIETLEALETEREALHKATAEKKERRSSLTATQKALTTDGQELNDRIDTLENTDSASCPLCGQALTDDHRAEILVQITAERDEKREIFRANREELADIKKTLKADEKRVKGMSSDLAKLPGLRKQAGILQQQLDDASDARKRLIEVQAQYDTVTKTLNEDDFAHALRDDLQTVDAERTAIGYDRDSHDSAREQLETYRAYETQYTALEIARSALPAAESALKNAEERHTRLSETITEEETALETMTTAIEKLKLLVDEQQRREQLVREQRQRVIDAVDKLGAARQRLTALQQQRESRLGYVERQHTAQQEHSIYKELQFAFGKNGVPAMMIETAIPELEVSANDLLARMTEGRMHLRLSTQREKVSGGSMETLDIEIADELGTRPYEMYSGGEAFRINFALRVALSKMLAGRAGAHLRTLFIDEGFGTQDDNGRSKLIEAITAVQQDFDMILVITHIAELRDSFPVHVVISKTPQGSMVQVQ